MDKLGGEKSEKRDFLGYYCSYKKSKHIVETARPDFGGVTEVHFYQNLPPFLRKKQKFQFFIKKNSKSKFSRLLLKLQQIQAHPWNRNTRLLGGL